MPAEHIPALYGPATPGRVAAQADLYRVEKPASQAAMSGSGAAPAHRCAAPAAAACARPGLGHVAREPPGCARAQAVAARPAFSGSGAVPARRYAAPAARQRAGDEVVKLAANRDHPPDGVCAETGEDEVDTTRRDRSPGPVDTRSRPCRERSIRISSPR
ncbi:hypothetical protein GCM10010116_03690 [Microbispora rosea subsp. aerata]|nr:hypothetical protein GCM10010116_03690 [Microbispora rosea subsp. aerata]GIH54730.1 hypothetical protein Mro02_16440 [Microbispora rosea subsp. aerata]GLJ86334.1 hypothetical protein GCM10017588_50700 [Microbispora rosea subsp. aerata]